MKMIAEPGKCILHVVILPTTIQQADEVVPTRLKSMTQRLPTCKNNS